MRCLRGKPLKIKVLGEWSTEREGRPILRGPNLRIVLHALVLGRGEVYREHLIELLAEHDRGAAHQDEALRNALTKLRGHDLRIEHGQNPVKMSQSQPFAGIDLWEFFAHVKLRRFQEAHALIADGQEPYLLPGVAYTDHPVWKDTLTAFEQARDVTLAAVSSSSRRQRSMMATRDRLLARSLVPGVGQPTPIREVRERIERLQVPWHQERPQEARPDLRLPDYLHELLADPGTLPTQAIVVGGVGAGKTLTAISTFLRLTDPLGGSGRTVLYADAEIEGSAVDFGERSWLQRRLREAGAGKEERPVVVVPHGDAFLSRQADLRLALDRELFREHDLLLCCGSQVYSRRLSYEDFGTHVFHLEPWHQELQEIFALALVGKRRYAEFVGWQEEDPTRRQLCGVPLHLVHVLALLDEDSRALTEISTPPQLLEGVARMRLSVSRPAFDHDELIEDLGSAAHKFYADASPSDAPIHFTAEELKQHLRARHRKDAPTRGDAMINKTLLAVSPGSQSIRFEDPAWARFFVARHVTHTLLYDPENAAYVLSRFLSSSMMGFCEQMLRERIDRYRDEIEETLRQLLNQPRANELPAARMRIAREQAAYLGGILGRPELQHELAAMVEPGSARREADSLVRRGIFVGLASGGEPRFADAYVEELAAELAGGGETPGRSLNLGFLLSLSGDQEFDAQEPTRIEPEVPPIRTVADLTRRLTEPATRGVGRLLLFSLIDLSRHPAISRAGFEEALDTSRTDLETVLVTLQNDGQAQTWSELEELQQILKPTVIRSHA